MNTRHYSNQLKQMTQERNWAFMLAGALVLSNIIIGATLTLRNREIVLLPFSRGETYEISAKQVSENYLTHMAKDVWSSFLDVTPDNIDYATRNLLQIVHPKHYGQIAQSLSNLADDLKNCKISTHFIPVELKTNRDQMTVQVSGYLETYLGSTRVSRDLKSYQVIFTHSGTQLLLSSFGEIHDE